MSPALVQNEFMNINLIFMLHLTMEMLSLALRLNKDNAGFWDHASAFRDKGTES